MNFPFPPSTPCASCLADPARQAFGQDGSMAAVHCPHNSAGGVYRPAAGKWTVVSPVTADEFADYLSRLGALHMRQVAAEDGIETKPN
jgi:hypothetical protein